MTLMIVSAAVLSVPMYAQPVVPVYAPTGGPSGGLTFSSGNRPGAGWSFWLSFGNPFPAPHVVYDPYRLYAMSPAYVNYPVVVVPTIYTYPVFVAKTKKHKKVKRGYWIEPTYQYAYEYQEGWDRTFRYDRYWSIDDQDYYCGHHHYYSDEDEFYGDDDRYYDDDYYCDDDHYYGGVAQFYSYEDESYRDGYYTYSDHSSMFRRSSNRLHYAGHTASHTKQLNLFRGQSSRSHPPLQASVVRQAPAARVSTRAGQPLATSTGVSERAFDAKSRGNDPRSIASNPNNSRVAQAPKVSGSNRNPAQLGRPGQAPKLAKPQQAPKVSGSNRNPAQVGKSPQGTKKPATKGSKGK